MVGFNREKLIKTMLYKLSFFENHTPLVNRILHIKIKDVDDSSHPSWKRRISYAMDYNFNAKLIERIATDAECTNDGLIAEIQELYKPRYIDLDNDAYSS